jgi:Icc-related predicted phosphoesterase
MKIAICSDLHLEFGNIDLTNDQGADVLVLSGDICVAADLVSEEGYLSFNGGKYHGFFKECCKNFKHVIYIAGNHEHYNGDFVTTYSIIKEQLSHLNNLYILDNEVKTIDDITFIGTTLWTDMNGGDENTMRHIRTSMSDFRVIKNSNRMTHRKVPVYGKDENNANVKIGMKIREEVSKLSPEDVILEHKKSVDYINMVVSKDKESKYVVVGHHAPSSLSIHPIYQNDTYMNGGYRSILDLFIEDRPQIKLWIHGHMHHTFDYTIGSTRVICNPRGYIGYEERANKFVLKYLEL